MVRLWDRALPAVDAGLTTPAEVRRVLGFNDPPAPRGSQNLPTPSTTVRERV